MHSRGLPSLRRGNVWKVKVVPEQLSPNCDNKDMCLECKHIDWWIWIIIIICACRLSMFSLNAHQLWLTTFAIGSRANENSQSDYLLYFSSIAFQIQSILIIQYFGLFLVRCFSFEHEQWTQLASQKWVNGKKIEHNDLNELNEGERYSTITKLKYK